MTTATDELRDDELDAVSGGIIAILIGLLLPAPAPPTPMPKPGPGPV
jgi:hypothetical protein